MKNFEAKPIFFKNYMVQAILHDYKTSTRQVARFKRGKDSEESYMVHGLQLLNSRQEPCLTKPPYQVGNILYVREAWAESEGEYYYKADRPECDGSGCPVKDCNLAVFCERSDGHMKWTSPIFMPKEAARIFLEVTGGRVERAWDITPEDCAKEGIYRDRCHYNGHKDCNCIDDFSHLWNSTIKPADLPLYGWEANPWVWIYEFERITT